MAKKQHVGTFLGTSPSILVEVKGWAYAYSGPQTTSDTAVDVLEYHTGKYTMLSVTQWYCPDELGDDYELTMKINGVEIFTFQVSTTGLNIGTNGQGPFYHIIPPLSTVTLEAKNVTDASTHPWSATVIGKILE